MVVVPVASCPTVTRADPHLAIGFELPSQRGQAMKFFSAMARGVFFLAVPTYPQRFQIESVYWTSFVGLVGSIRDEKVHSEVQDFQGESRSFPRRTKKGRWAWPFEW